jgi:hypothetical protein
MSTPTGNNPPHPWTKLKKDMDALSQESTRELRQFFERIVLKELIADVDKSCKWLTK